MNNKSDDLTQKYKPNVNSDTTSFYIYYSFFFSLGLEKGEEGTFALIF